MGLLAEHMFLAAFGVTSICVIGCKRLVRIRCEMFVRVGGEFLAFWNAYDSEPTGKLFECRRKIGAHAKQYWGVEELRHFEMVGCK